MGKDRAMESKRWKMDFCRSSESYLVCRICSSFVLYCIGRADQSLLYFHDRRDTASRVNNTEEVTMHDNQ
jgi:hypothetical protein